MVQISTSEYLDWAEIEQNLDELKARALDELVRIYNNSKDLDNYPFKFGDEIEFSLVKLDHSRKKVYLLLKAASLFDAINKSREEQEELKQIEFHKEYAAYMIETIPGAPFDDDINTLCKIQENFKLRRKLISQFLDKDERVLSLTCFPMLGCNEFTWPSYEPSPQGGCFNSIFFPDEAICNERAFHFATKNINARRKCKVRINVPIFVDTNTPKPFDEHLPMISQEEKDAVQKNDHIYMDWYWIIFHF
jgi:glutamate--cysteine ligase catalytic subunit